MENKQFTKDDLKVGYVVKLRNGDVRIYMPCSFFSFSLVSTNGTITSCYDIDLRNTEDSCWDVMEVYGYAKNAGSALMTSIQNRELLWKREETKKMTVEEIEKELGYKIEIVS